MLQLIKIEWLKIKRYPAFWWMLGIVALTYPGINIMFTEAYNNTINRKGNMAAQLAKMLLGNPFEFPETWHTVAFFSSIFVMLPAILVIMLVTNEYNYKTHRQNIIDGWSRQQYITAKMMDVVIVALVATIMYTIVALIIGIYMDDGHLGRWAEQLHYIPLFFLQTFAQLSIAFVLGYIIKKAFIALGVFLFYNIIVENFLVNYYGWNKGYTFVKFLPFEMSDRIIPWPAFMGRSGKDMQDVYNKILAAIPEQLIYTLIFTALIWLFCYRLQAKKDL